MPAKAWHTTHLEICENDLVLPGAACFRGPTLTLLGGRNVGSGRENMAPDTPPFEMLPMSRHRRQKRDLHALNDDGMVLCNPRDKEAAHRAEMEGIATPDRAAVTCRKCRSLLYDRAKARNQEE